MGYKELQENAKIFIEHFKFLMKISSRSRRNHKEWIELLKICEENDFKLYKKRRKIIKKSKYNFQV